MEEAAEGEIERLLKQIGMTVSHVASQIGVSEDAIYKWQRTRRIPPDCLSTLKLMATAASTGHLNPAPPRFNAILNKPKEITDLALLEELSQRKLNVVQNIPTTELVEELRRRGWEVHPTQKKPS